jgi:hypothetical protein
MGFWGMSDAGKEAGGNSRELGAWSNQQMRNWLARGNNYSDLSDFYNTGAADYWTERRNEGFADPRQITATGQEISPWVQPYIQSQRDRRGQMKANESSRRTAGEVADEMSGRLDEMGRRIGENYTDQEGEINQTSERAMGREQGASNDVVENIKGSSASMRGAVNDTFGLLRGDNASTYGGIKDAGKTSFAKQAANLALIKPGGQAQAARVGRSFAGQTSDVMQRLKRMGIDPNSPEAAAALRGVETDRSRAMDDATAGATDSFINRSNDIENAQLGFMTGADRARLENESGLATGQVDRSNRITGAEADAFNAEKRTNAGNLNNIDRDRSGRASENLDASFQRGQSLTQDRNNLTTWGRNAGMEDVDRLNAQIEREGEDEASAGSLLNNQFDRGMAWQGANQQTKDNAVTNLGQIANRYRDSAFQSAGTAQQFGQQAANAYNTTYDREKANAGWGARMLGGIAGGVMDMYAPGSGQILTGAMNGAYGGSGGGSGGSGGGGGGGGQYGGGWGGGQNPYTFSAVPQQAYTMPIWGGRTTQNGLPSGPAYDPTKTRTLPNGSLQVGAYSTNRNPTPQWGTR